MIGQSIAHYRVTAKLGAGGMGEVYRASDMKLGRDVALKVLPAAFASDAERMARFEREAQVLASLNHPNIAAIYGLEESHGIRALVMELVEGPTLADRIAAGALPVQEALHLADEIAAALEAAHEKGIVHRDLKPANVKAAPEGVTKVLDFGLAKALAGDGAEGDTSNSPTLTSPATRHGMILGTAAYMSPEQARGRKVDRRADIWSFGCVLYEMLTRKQGFGGDTVTDILAAVVRAEPDWNALPMETPPQIRQLLRRCLEKDPKRRLRDIGEARVVFEELRAGPSSTMAMPAAQDADAPRAWRKVLPWALASVLAAALIFSVWSSWRKPEVNARPHSRVAVVLPPMDSLGTRTGLAVALSPDGSRMVYVGRRAGTYALYLREMDQLEAKAIPGTEGAYNPFFSPDGQWIGFFTIEKLKKVSIQGGPVLALCEVHEAQSGGGGAWAPDDTIYFAGSRTGGISRVSAAGGVAEVVTRPDPKKGEHSHRWPSVLPGGQAILFVSETGSSFEDARIAVLSLKSGEIKRLNQIGSGPHYASTGHLVYARSGSLLAAPFDLATLDVTGPPVPLVENVATNSGSGASHFSISDDGWLAYVPGSGGEDQRSLVWVDRKGVSSPMLDTQRPFEDLALSPDARQLALTVEGATWNIWTYDLIRGTLTRLTFVEDNRDPVWTPDGKRIVFGTFRKSQYGLFWKAADGSGAEERLTLSDNWQWPTSITPDGKALCYSERDPNNGMDIWILPLEGERKPRLFLQTPYAEWGGMFSPDGRWLAYWSNESGRDEVYVQAYPGPGGKWQVSTEGGSRPVWSKNGRELFYPVGEKIMVADIEAGAVLKIGKPRVLFEGRFWDNAGHFYAITPNGTKFVMLKENEQQSTATQINVVLNWFDELERRVPGKKK